VELGAFSLTAWAFRPGAITPTTPLLLMMPAVLVIANAVAF
jgi:hypothetical protein